MTELPRLGRDEFSPPKLYHIRIVGLGMAHICIGILTIALGICDIAFTSLLFDIFPTAKVGTALWVGSVIILTGTIGVVTSRSELRRRTANFVFMILSSLSWLLCIVMIGIGIAAIASSEFAEGELKMQQELTPGTECLKLNVTHVDALNNTIRCIPKSMFDQQLVFNSLMVALGYIEGMVAFYSVIIAYEIYTKLKLSFQTNQNVGMTHIPEIPHPELTVNHYFEERLQREEEQRANNFTRASQNKNHIPLEGANAGQHTLHTSASSGDFPDSEQFRSHLEGLQ